MELWDEHLSKTVRGMFLYYKYAARQMIKQSRGGKIIGATQIMTFRGTPHDASKLASSLRGLNETLNKRSFRTCTPRLRGSLPCVD